MSLTLVDLDSQISAVEARLSRERLALVAR